MFTPEAIIPSIVGLSTLIFLFFYSRPRIRRAYYRVYWKSILKFLDPPNPFIQHSSYILFEITYDGALIIYLCQKTYSGYWLTPIHHFLIEKICESFIDIKAPPEEQKKDPAGLRQTLEETCGDRPMYVTW